MVQKYIFVMMALFFGVSPVFADEVHLNNQDILHGKVIQEDGEFILLESETLGVVKLPKANIVKMTVGEPQPAEPQPEEKKQVEWKRELSAGYTRISGNTESSELTTSLHVNRKTEKNEYTAKGTAYYSSEDKKMNARKYYGMGRYAYSFGKTKKWFNFYKFEAEHDKFANIAYRLIPSTGLGYWFSDTDTWKAMTELGIGVTHTHFADEKENENELVLIPRVFLEKTLWGKVTLSEDFTIYPALTDPGTYRFHSDAALTTPLNKWLSLRLNLVNDYNSSPGAGTKKHDIRFLSSLVYTWN